MRRVLFLVKKEFIQILRDWRTLSLSLLLPLVVLFLFGYAITLDIKEIPLAVVDYSKTRASRDLVRRFTASGYFKAREVPFPEAASMLDRGEAKMVMVLPRGSAAPWVPGRPPRFNSLLTARTTTPPTSRWDTRLPSFKTRPPGFPCSP